TMEFDSVIPVEVPVRIGDERFVLREASEDAAVRWRNACARCARMVDGKVVAVGDIADTEPQLLSWCLYEGETIRLLPDGSPDPKHLVSAQRIRRWPARVVKALYDEARRISGLDERDTRKTLLDRIAKLKEQLDQLEDAEDTEAALGNG